MRHVAGTAEYEEGGVIAFVNDSGMPFVEQFFDRRGSLDERVKEAVAMVRRRVTALGSGSGGDTVSGDGPVCLSQVADLPVVLDVPWAGRLLGIGRTRAYRLANSGGFPCRVIRVGGTWRVPTADLLALLGLPALPGAVAASGRVEVAAPAADEKQAALRPVLHRSVVVRRSR